MNRKFFSIISVVAVVFALVLGFGTLDSAKAVPAANGEGYAVPAGDVNLFAFDGADVAASAITRDPDLGTGKSFQDSYGLSGKSQL